MNKRKTYWLFIFNFFTCSPDIPHVYLTENKDTIINCTLMLNRNLITVFPRISARGTYFKFGF